MIKTSFLFSALPDVPTPVRVNQYVGRAYCRWDDEDDKRCPDWGQLPSVGGNERYPLDVSGLWESTHEYEREREWHGHCTDGRCVYVIVYADGDLYVHVSRNDEHDPERTDPIFRRRIGARSRSITTEDVLRHTAHLWEPQS